MDIKLSFVDLLTVKRARGGLCIEGSILVLDQVPEEFLGVTGDVSSIFLRPLIFWSHHQHALVLLRLLLFNTYFRGRAVVLADASI